MAGVDPRGHVAALEPAGRELFFVAEDGLFVVPAKRGASFVTERPRFLFKVKPFGGRLGADLEISPDGRRFMFILDGPPAAATPAHLVFVQHWVEELRTRLAEAR